MKTLLFRKISLLSIVDFINDATASLLLTALQTNGSFVRFYQIAIIQYTRMSNYNIMIKVTNRKYD